MSERNTSGGKCAGFSGSPPTSGDATDIGEIVAELEAGAYLMMIAPVESCGGVETPSK